MIPYNFQTSSPIVKYNETLWSNHERYNRLFATVKFCINAKTFQLQMSTTGKAVKDVPNTLKYIQGTGRRREVKLPHMSSQLY
jgi:hypothetical protein